MTPLKFLLATLLLVAINIGIGWWVAARTARRRRVAGRTREFRSRVSQ
jgi:hypothetical protein